MSLISVRVQIVSVPFLTSCLYTTCQSLVLGSGKYAFLAPLVLCANHRLFLKLKIEDIKI